MRKSAVFVILTVLALFVTMSCQIGLGQAVDTEPPTVEFTNPPIDAKLRSTFSVRGTFKDDGIITAVIVRLESTDGNGIKYDYVGSIDLLNGTWKAEIDPRAEGKVLTDGSYQATVYMSDMGGHITTQSRTFSVDNTAPVVVLQRPASKASDSPDSYGQSFTLTGQAADNSDISLIELKIYSDPERQNLIHTVNLTNVPPTISLDAARFEEGVENDYSKIYGSTGKNGTKDFYCSIAAYDGTQRYPADGSDQTEEDKKGNCTNTYYLYEEISTSVLSNYKITEVYQMFSGVFKNSSAEKSATEIVNEVNKSLEGKQIDVGHFSLNPANNPYFTVSGYNTLPSSGISEFLNKDENVIQNNTGNVLISVSPGLDGIPLKSDTLKPYVIECDSNANVLSGAEKLYLPINSTEKKGTAYNYTTSFSKQSTPQLEIDHYYRFGVDGNDEGNNSIMNNGNGYAFKFVKNGSAPELSDPVFEPDLGKNGSGKYITNGTLKVRNGKLMNFQNVTASSWEFVLEDGTSLGSGTLSQNISFDVDTKDYDLKAGTLTLKFTDDIGNETTKPFYFYIDQSTDKPTIEANSGSFNASLTYNDLRTKINNRDKENANLFIKGSTLAIKLTDDDGILDGGVKVTCTPNTTDGTATFTSGTPETKPVQTTGSQKTTIVTYDLPKTSGSYKIEIEVEDIYGNLTTSKKKIEFFVQVTGNAPDAVVSATPSWITTNTEGLDETLKAGKDQFKVKITVKDGTPAFAVSGENIPAGAKINAVGDSYEYDFKPAAGNGSDTVVYTVTDNYGNDKSVDFDYKVDNKKPTVVITSSAPDTSATENASFTFTGTASDADSGIGRIDVSFDKTKIYTASGTSDWSYIARFAELNPLLTEGLNEFYVRAVDNVGNIGEWEKQSFIYDKASPVVTIEKYTLDGASASPVVNNAFDSGKKFSIEGSYSDGYGVRKIVVTQKKDDGTEETIQTITSFTDPKTGTWKVENLPRKEGTPGTHELATGKYTYTVKVYDKCDDDDSKTKVSSKIVTATIDVSAPKIEISSPSADYILSGASTVLKGTIQDEGSVGAAKFYYAITDSATAPAAGNAAWTEVSKTTSGTASDTWDIPKDLGTGPASGVAGSEIGEGKWYLHMKAEDKAGNITPNDHVVSRQFYVDQAAPVLSSIKKDSQTGTELKENEIFYYKPGTDFVLSGKILESNGIKAFTATVEGMSPVTITKPAASATAQDWTCTISGIAANSLKKLTVNVTDNADRTTSKVFNIYGDTDVPEVSITNPAEDYNPAENGDDSLSWTESGDGSYKFRASAIDLGSGIPENKFKYQFTQAEYTVAPGKTLESVLAEDIASAAGSSKWNEYTGQIFTNTQTLTSGAASVTGKLNEGKWFLYIYAKDKVGNEKALKRVFYVDKSAPAVTTKLDGASLATTETQTKTANTYLVNFSIAETNGLDSTAPCTVTVKKDNNTTLVRGTDYKIYTGTSPSLTEFTGNNFAAGTEYTIKLETTASDGLYSYIIDAKDICGKTSSITRNVRLDTVGPVLSFESPSFSKLNVADAYETSAWQTSSRISVIGTASDVSGIEAVYYSYKPVAEPSLPSAADAKTESKWTAAGWTKLEGTSNWNISETDSNDGVDFGLYVAAVDKFGNLSAKYKKIIRKDSTRPSLEETSVKTTGVRINASTSPAKVILSGTMSDASSGLKTISVGNGSETWSIPDLSADYTTGGWTWKPVTGTAEEKDKWTLEIPVGSGTGKLSDGDHLLSIDVQDVAGNIYSVQRSVSIDTKVPVTGAMSIETAKNFTEGSGDSAKNWYNNSSIGIKVAAVEDLKQNGYASGIASVEYAVNASGISDAGATWIPLTKGTETDDAANENVKKADWTATVNCTQQGKNTIYVRVKDVAGNLASALSKEVYIDTVAPAIPTSYWVDGVSNLTGSKLINRRDTVTVNIVAADSGNSNEISGIKQLTYNNKTTSKVTGKTSYTPAVGTAVDVYSLVVSNADLPTTDGAAVIVIEDNVGNEYKWQPFAFSVDTEAPTVEIKTPANAGTKAGKVLVNKTINFNGTATDLRGLKTVDICYYINADTPAGASPAFTGKTWTHLARINSNPSVWSTSLDTTTAFGTIPDETEVILCAIATDEAGNRNLDTIADGTVTDNTIAIKNASGIETGRKPSLAPDAITNKAVNTYSIIVDQDTDRPVIKFTTMTLGTGMSGASRIGYENTDISGNVTDDDGIPSALEYKIGAAGTWGTTGLTYSSVDGLFTLSLDDGQKDIYFRVKDDPASTAAGSNVYFEPNTSGTYNVNSIKVTDKADDKYGYRQEGSPVASLYNSVVYTTIDTNPPEVVTPEYTRDKSDASSWSSDISSQVFGGTKKTFYLHQYAYDINGVKSVYLSIPKNDGDGTSPVVTAWSYTNPISKVKTTYYTNGSNPATGADYWETSDITKSKKGTIAGANAAAGTITVGTTAYVKEAYIFPLKNDATAKWPTDNRYTLWESENPIDVAGLATGNRTASLIASDGIKQATSTVNLVIDFTAPNISVNGPVSGGQNSGSITAYGSVDSVADVYYAISTSDTINPDSGTAVTTWKDNQGNSTTISDIKNKSLYGFNQISNANISWFVYFDNDLLAEGTHQKIMNDYLVNYGITTPEALAATDSSQFGTLVQLYLWIKAVDSCGNIAYKVQPFVLDPQGDRPELRFSYPTEDGKTYGGEIRVTGSASDEKASNNDKIGVESVWAQIIATDHQLHQTFDTDGNVSTDPDGWNTKTFGGFTKDASDAVSTFTVKKADLDYLKAAGLHLYNTKTYHNGAAGQTEYNGTIPSGYSASDYAIRCTLSGSSWSLPINTSGEFNVNSGTNGVAIRMFAQDLDGKYSVYSHRYMVFDAQNPVIGNSQPLYLIQSASNTITGTALSPNFNATSYREYSEDMYVRGEWYIIGSVEDNDTINNLRINNDDLIKEQVAQTSAANKWATLVSADKKTVFFKYKLSTGTGVGNVSFNIYTEDKATPTCGKTTKTIKLYYDNQAPTLLGAESSGYDINPSVKQSDGFYHFGSKVTEETVGTVSQSGLDYVAFYFMRRNTAGATEVDSIYNPMIASSNSTTVRASTPILGSALDTGADGSIVYDSGLYWIKKTVTRSADLSSLGVATDSSIRKNGLVKIGGSIYKISKDGYSASGIKVIGNPPAGVTTAYFAIAMVADNTVQESGGTSKDATTGYPTSISNDDGDGMVEYVKKNGTDWTWEANIVSRNIPDGPIELHYIAFDAAGNYSVGIMGNMTETLFKDSNAEYTTGKKYAQTPDRVEYQTLRGSTGRASNVLYVDGTSKKSCYNGTDSTITNTNLWDAAFIANNAPRLAAVTVWTDYNGNGTKDDGESSIFYNDEKDFLIGGIGQKRAKSVTEKLIVSGNGKDYDAEGTSFLTIRDKTSFTPEIVGGNGVLYYKSRVAKAADIGTKTYSALSSAFVTGNGQSDDYLDSTGSYVDTGSTKLRRGEIVFNDFGAGKAVTDNDLYWFDYKIYDSTEGTTPGTNSLSATMRVALNVDYFDSTKPKTFIKPLFWESADKGKNSVYVDSSDDSIHGHVELKRDLEYMDGDTKVTTALGTTYGTDDDKVSGKIVFRGTAFDNRRLKSITWGFDNSSGTGIWSKTIVPATFDGTSWTSTATFDTNGYELKIYADSTHDAYFDGRGHKVEWELTVDTSQITGVVAKDAKVYVLATDASDKTTDKTETPVTVGTDAQKVNPSYKVDVLPYITNVNTRLYKKGGKDYARTANGHYPIASNEGAVVLQGYNLAAGNEDVTISAATVAGWASGSYAYTVSGTISTINNLNNNNAKGDFDDTGLSESKRVANMYNRSPNTNANLMLNDDVYFDMWELNNKAATSRGALKDPVMHINQGSADKEIGFGFVNSADGVSFPAGGNSYVWFQKNRKDYKGTNFVYDNNGVAHNISIGLDAQASTGIAGRMNYNNSNWYSTSSYGSDVGHNGEGTISQWNLRYNIALETIGIPKGVNLKGTTLGANIIDTDRFVTPSIAVSTHGANKTPTVYIMYYDTDHQQIRFRYGEINQSRNLNANSRYRQVNNNDQYESYGLLNDSKSENHYASATSTTTTIPSDTEQNNNTWANHNMFEASKDYYALVAGQYYKQKNNNKAAFNTGNKGSAYYGLDVVPGNAIDNDKVVMIWYDEDAQKLMYMYRENLTADGDNTDASSAGVANKWSKPVALVSDILLQDCVIKVDSKGGIHIAYYDQSNADLIYGYMSAYNQAANFKTCVVDAYSQVGNRISIDTAVHATNGKVVPYISYFSDGMSSLPKMAYLPNGVGAKADVMDGASASTKLFTGNWEVTLIPTSSILQAYNVGIGVWKDGNGKAVKQAKKAGVPYSTTNYNQKCYANGTSELVVGYSIKQSGVGYMETAMRK